MNLEVQHCRAMSALGKSISVICSRNGYCRSYFVSGIEHICNDAAPMYSLIISAPYIVSHLLLCRSLALYGGVSRVVPSLLVSTVCSPHPPHPFPFSSAFSPSFRLAPIYYYLIPTRRFFMFPFASRRFFNLLVLYLLVLTVHRLFPSLLFMSAPSATIPPSPLRFFRTVISLP